MGIIRQGANGGYSGKVGSTIGSSWKDINYIKGLPKKSSKPPTEAQLKQQAKFKLALNFLKSIASLLHNSFSALSKKRLTGFNCAIQSLLKRAITGVYPDYGVDYSKVKVSEGSLLAPRGQASAGNSASILLSWNTKTTTFSAFADDKITVLLYDEADNYFDTYENGVTRSVGEMEIPLEASVIGQTLHVYYFFTDRLGKKYSPSMYAGSVVIQ